MKNRAVQSCCNSEFHPKTSSRPIGLPEFLVKSGVVVEVPEEGNHNMNQFYQVKRMLRGLRVETRGFSSGIDIDSRSKVPILETYS